jgi:hypothetical protein
MLVQDGWLTLVSGREIASHGLPHHDTLTAWTVGREWIDQQWLAQLAFYGLFAGGGLKLVLLTHTALLAAALVLAVVAARRLGGSEQASFLIAALGMFAAPAALQFRAQSFAPLLFVAVLYLLAADSRAPSRRVYLVLPLLVVWANLHGTVVLGAALVVVAALVSAVRRLAARELGLGSALRTAALIGLAPLCVLASPYGFALVGYYHQLLLDPGLHWFIDEWQPTSLGIQSALFFVLAATAVAIVARHGARLSVFERCALGLTLVSGLLAERSTMWFALAAIVILPSAATDRGRMTPWRPGPAQIKALAAAGAAAAALLVFVAAAARPDSWYVREWPEEASSAVATAMSGDPSVRVFADDRYADWILWRHPELTGRVAYDVRFELFSTAQFRKLYAYRNEVGDWKRAARGYDLLLFDDDAQPHIKPAAVRDGARVLYDGKGVAVLDTGTS